MARPLLEFPCAEEAADSAELRSARRISAFQAVTRRRTMRSQLSSVTRIWSLSREQQIAGSRRHAEWLEIETLQVESVCTGIVGRSPAIRTVVAAIERFAPHKGTVLVTGESGTGKEVVTRALHQRGPFADGPLVSFNCSNLVSGRPGCKRSSCVSPSHWKYSRSARPRPCGWICGCSPRPIVICARW